MFTCFMNFYELGNIQICVKQDLKIIVTWERSLFLSQVVIWTSAFGEGSMAFPHEVIQRARLPLLSLFFLPRVMFSFAFQDG